MGIKGGLNLLLILSHRPNQLTVLIAVFITTRLSPRTPIAHGSPTNHSASPAEKEAQMIRLTGLWKNKSKDGTTYLSGTIGMAKVVILPNTYKKTDKDPVLVADKK